MNEEEKKAIEYTENCLMKITMGIDCEFDVNILDTLLNIIKKLQKENEELKYKIKGQECVIETQVHNEEVYESIFEKLEKENKELKKQVKSDVNTIF